MKSVEIKVITIPSHISAECPHCCEDVEVPYMDFTSMAGEPCDWRYSSFECPNCESTINIDSVDWQ